MSLLSLLVLRFSQITDPHQNFPQISCNVVESLEFILSHWRISDQSVTLVRTFVVCRGRGPSNLLNSPDVQRMNSFAVLGTGLLTCCLSPKAAVDANNTSYKQVKLHCSQPTTKVETLSSSIELRAKRQSDV